MEKIELSQAKKTSEVTWEIPLTAKDGMRVPVKIFATEKLFKEMDQGVFEQAINFSTLPRIQKYSYVMPDGHIFVS